MHTDLKNLENPILSEQSRAVTKKRPFFLLSILLVLIGLVLHVVAQGEMMQGEHLRAQDLETAVKQREASNQYNQPIHRPLDPEADRLLQSSNTLYKVGFVFTFLCVASMGVAAFRRESGWYPIPALLLIFDVLILLEL
jgi:hypothetical protein